MTDTNPIIASSSILTSEEQISDQEDKHHRLFDHLAIWALSGEVKNDLAKTIIDDLNTGVGYRAQMILSVVIATLGLLTNSTSVVIGAMLIAPILRPIQGLAFSTVTGNHGLFGRSLGLLLSSVLVGVGVGFMITWLIPFAQPTAEILVRTQPNLLDLFIALASGIIAFLALGYKKIANSLAGVAMAAALVPPLTVIGAGLAFGDMSIARGSLILFATNLIAIIIVGVIVLMMLGFSPNAKKSYHQSVRRMVSILILLALLCIPLMQSFVNIGQDLRTKDIITSSTKNYLQTIDSRIRVTSSTYQLSPSVEQGIEIALQLQVPQSITLTQDQKLELTQLLAQALDESVNLQFVITPTVSVAKPTEYIPTTKELLDTAIIAYLKDSSDTITYLASNYVESADIYVLSLYAPSDEPITLRESEIMDYIHTLDTDPAEVIIDRRQPQIIPTPAEQTATDKLTSELRQIFSNYVGTAMVLENIVLDENIDLLQLNLTSYISSDETKSLLSGRQATLDSDLSLNAQVQYGERVRVE